MRRFDGCRAEDGVGFGFRIVELSGNDRWRAAETGELMGNGFLLSMVGIEMLARDNLRLGAS